MDCSFEANGEWSRSVFKRIWEETDLPSILGVKGNKIIDLSLDTGELSRTIDKCGCDYLIYEQSYGLFLDNRVINVNNPRSPYTNFTMRLLDSQGNEQEYFRIEKNLKSNSCIPVPRYKLQVNCVRETGEITGWAIIATTSLYDYIRKTIKLQHIVTCKNFLCDICDKEFWDHRRLHYVTHTTRNEVLDRKWISISWIEVKNQLIAYGGKID